MKYYKKSLRLFNSEQVSYGGPERTRTACLIHAMDALYQVSYGPMNTDVMVANF